MELSRYKMNMATATYKIMSIFLLLVLLQRPAADCTALSEACSDDRQGRVVTPDALQSHGRRHWIACSYRVHLQLQSFDFAYNHPLACCNFHRGNGVPNFTMHHNLPSWRQCSLSSADFPD